MAFDKPLILLTGSRFFLLKLSYISINDLTIVLVLKLLLVFGVLIIDKALYDCDQSTQNQVG